MREFIYVHRSDIYNKMKEMSEEEDDFSLNFREVDINLVLQYVQFISRKNQSSSSKESLDFVSNLSDVVFEMSEGELRFIQDNFYSNANLVKYLIKNCYEDKKNYTIGSIIKLFSDNINKEYIPDNESTQLVFQLSYLFFNTYSSDLIPIELFKDLFSFLEAANIKFSRIDNILKEKIKKVLFEGMDTYSNSMSILFLQQESYFKELLNLYKIDPKLSEFLVFNFFRYIFNIDNLANYSLKEKDVEYIYDVLLDDSIFLQKIKESAYKLFNEDKLDIKALSFLITNSLDIFDSSFLHLILEKFLSNLKTNNIDLTILILQELFKRNNLTNNDIVNIKSLANQSEPYYQKVFKKKLSMYVSVYEAIFSNEENLNKESRLLKDYIKLLLN